MIILISGEKDDLIAALPKELVPFDIRKEKLFDLSNIFLNKVFNYH